MDVFAQLASKTRDAMHTSGEMRASAYCTRASTDVGAAGAREDVRGDASEGADGAGGRGAGGPGGQGWTWRTGCILRAARLGLGESRAFESTVSLGDASSGAGGRAVGGQRAGGQRAGGRAGGRA
ncbi:hypothetical protein AcV7_004435 [Taiwanofungus camphoratus]|nr:hypothetical protein AcV7_004435 [Antrodia cinnamomea]